MKAFLSYAAEQFELANDLARRLKSDGVDVFFDREKLVPGDAFDTSIRQAVAKADVFIFLASADSLRPGNYTLTELGFAEQRWPTATGRVLTVIVDDTPLSSLPGYLRSVSVLKPRGDTVAETVAAVDQLARRRRRTRRVVLATIGLALVLSLALWKLYTRPQSPFLIERVTVSKEGNDYRFATELRNLSPRAVTTVRLFPETDRDDVHFSSTMDWFRLAPGEETSQSVVTQLNRQSAGAAFNWRLCWVVVDAFELDMAEGKVPIYQFIDQQGRTVCSHYRPWRD